MKLSAIIYKTVWKEIKDQFLLLYPDQKKNLPGYERVFSELRAMEPCRTGFVILLENAIDARDQAYVSITGYEPETGDPEEEDPVEYGIELTPWEEWLGMEINSQSMEEFSEPEIICHCLYWMTFYGFSKKEISKFADDLLNDDETPDEPERLKD